MSQPLLLVDADSCPKPQRAIILKAALKRNIPTLFVADRSLPDVIEAQHPEIVSMLVVEKGDDSADDTLVTYAKQGFGLLAITRDMVLADRLVELNLTVIDDRGGVYTKDNMKERLSLRNLMTDLREQGIYAQKTRPLGPKEIQGFANALDRELTRLVIQ
ncbi:MAG: DUF188 domain-containing protein [Sphaerochaetaceae bacterium]